MLLDYQSHIVASNPCEHIRTFVSGRGEKYYSLENCHCTYTDAFVPSYVGSNYYC